MSGDYYQKAERLLDIIHDLAISNENVEMEDFPFKEKEGEIEFHPALKAQLDKSENAELRDWATENIKELF